MIFIILCLKDTKFLINVCFQYQFFKKNLDKVPDVAQQDLVAFLEPGTQVGSQVQHSGLRVWHCRSYGLGNWGWDLIPSSETTYALDRPKQGEKNQNQTNKKQTKTKQKTQLPDFWGRPLFVYVGEGRGFFLYWVKSQMPSCHFSNIYPPHLQ